MPRPAQTPGQRGLSQLRCSWQRHRHAPACGLTSGNPEEWTNYSHTYCISQWLDSSFRAQKKQHFADSKWVHDLSELTSVVRHGIFHGKFTPFVEINRFDSPGQLQPASPPETLISQRSSEMGLRHSSTEKKIITLRGWRTLLLILFTRTMGLGCTSASCGCNAYYRSKHLILTFWFYQKKSWKWIMQNVVVLCLSDTCWGLNISCVLILHFWASRGSEGGSRGCRHLRPDTWADAWSDSTSSAPHSHVCSLLHGRGPTPQTPWLQPGVHHLQ